MTIEGGTNKFSTVYVSYSSGSDGKITIKGGENNTFSTVYIGYNSTGTLEITGGETEFSEALQIGRNTYVGTMTITGGTTTFSGTTTFANANSSLTIGDKDATTSEKATVYLETQIGSNSSNGKVTITGNANIVLSGALLDSIAALADSGSGDPIPVICANTITFGNVEITGSGYNTSGLDSLVNQYVSAKGYELGWSYSSGTLSIVSAKIIPEPELFSMFLGISALGLMATRRRRRKVA